MRMHYKRSIIGFDVGTVRQAFSVLDADFQSKLASLESEMENRLNVGRELKERAQSLEPMLSSSESLRPRPAYEAGALKLEGALLSRASTEAPHFRNTLFGWNRKQVQTSWKRHKQLQATRLEEADALLARIVRGNEELEDWIRRTEAALGITQPEPVESTESDVSSESNLGAAQMAEHVEPVPFEELEAAEVAEVTMLDQSLDEAVVSDAAQEAAAAGEALLDAAVIAVEEVVQPEPAEQADPGAAANEQIESFPEAVMVEQPEPVVSNQDGLEHSIQASAAPDRQQVQESKSGKVVSFRKRESVPEPIEPAKAAEPLPQTVNRSPAYAQPPSKPRAVGIGFWDDTDRYLEQALIDPTTAVGSAVLEPSAGTAEERLAMTGTGSTYFSVDAAPEAVLPAAPYLKQPVAAPVEPAIQKAPASEPVMSKPAASDPAAAGSFGPQTAPTTQTRTTGSPAVTEEIRRLRSKYIVGRTAGEDLYDYQARLIVKKGQLITQEVMDRAEAEGKLAELIVNMIIPGLGE